MENLVYLEQLGNRFGYRPSTSKRGRALFGSGPSPAGNSADFSGRSRDQAGRGIWSWAANCSTTHLGMSRNISDFASQTGSADPGYFALRSGNVLAANCEWMKSKRFPIRALNSWQKFDWKNYLNANWDSGHGQSYSDRQNGGIRSN